MYLLALPVGLFAAWRLDEPETEPTAEGFGYLRNALGAVAGGDVAVLYGAAFLTEVLLFSAVITGLPFLLTATYAIAPVYVGLVLTASEATSTIVSTQNGRFAQYLSNHGLVALGFECYGVGLLGAWLAPSPVLTAVAVGVFGAGLGLSMPGGRRGDQRPRRHGVPRWCAEPPEQHDVPRAGDRSSTVRGYRRDDWIRGLVARWGARRARERGPHCDGIEPRRSRCQHTEGSRMTDSDAQSSATVVTALHEETLPFRLPVPGAVEPPSEMTRLFRPGGESRSHA